MTYKRLSLYLISNELDNITHTEMIEIKKVNIINACC